VHGVSKARREKKLTFCSVAENQAQNSRKEPESATLGSVSPSSADFRELGRGKKDKKIWSFLSPYLPLTISEGEWGRRTGFGK